MHCAHFPAYNLYHTFPLTDTYYVGISRKKPRKEDNFEEIVDDGRVYVSEHMHLACFMCRACEHNLEKLTSWNACE